MSIFVFLVSTGLSLWISLNMLNSFLRLNVWEREREKERNISCNSKVKAYLINFRHDHDKHDFLKSKSYRKTEMNMNYLEVIKHCNGYLINVKLSWKRYDNCQLRRYVLWSICMFLWILLPRRKNFLFCNRSSISSRNKCSVLFKIVVTQ